MAKRGINLSDLDFHSMITGRYRKIKRNPYDFPLMIFFKNQGQSISNKISLNVLLQFSIKNNLKISQITGRGINNLFKWSGIEKYFLNIISFYNKTKLSKSDINAKDFHDIFSKSIVNNSFTDQENIVKIINPDLYSQFHPGFLPEFGYICHPELEYVMLPHMNPLLNNMTMGSALYSKKLFDFFMSENVKKQLTGYGNNMKVSSPDNYITLENKYQVTLPIVNLLLNSMTMGGALNSREFFKTNHPFLLSGNVSPVFLKHMDLSRISANGNDFAFGHQGSYYSFPMVGLVGRELAGDDSIHPVNIRHTNVHSANIQSANVHSANNQFANIHSANVHSAIIQPVNIRITNKQVTNPVYHSLLKYHFPGISQKTYQRHGNLHTGIFSHMKSFLKSITRLTVPDMITMLQSYPAGEFTKAGESTKPIIKNDLSVSAKANLEPVAKLDIPVNNSDLHFKTNTKIEHEIEEAKRIAREAKQTVIDRLSSVPTLHDEEIKRKIDIKQLSDQVYQLLDRKITIEKERRGYI
ncbi:MAG: hypothetical protein OIN84_03910 [Candidatus Methanoperedens sp.]|uniref:hypothetical protein n=1 Tax=Candidatus Methanoperedens sp. BLZ2 TaxID=2035255 RepID=UPI000BE3ECA8|nr:hypothetical protein [Candidatus Methanoperedens sp. BLZ2]KAB2944600.1 MAG: hypothetical protein F9K14_14010 [Candidatus Methanoperedens sp.]MBZ0176867.1 hypothetical protein [Candidatus Methanoperedens nitroreducens]MCX9077100.1 hypothetical protein [Candidatus Methanoperedens sp.]